MTDPYNINRVIFANVVLIFRFIVFIILSVIRIVEHSIVTLFLVSIVQIEGDVLCGCVNENLVRYYGKYTFFYFLGHGYSAADS